MSENNTPKPEHTPKCTLSDQELGDRLFDWAKQLAESGGRKWCLSIPVNLNRDPDILMTEAGDRLKELTSLRDENKRLREALEGISPVDEYIEEKTDGQIELEKLFDSYEYGEDERISVIWDELEQGRKNQLKAKTALRHER